MCGWAHLWTPMAACRLVDAFQEYDEFFALSRRQYVPPNFAELRHILNIAQVRARAGSQRYEGRIEWEFKPCEGLESGVEKRERCQEFCQSNDKPVAGASCWAEGQPGWVSPCHRLL